MPPLNATTKQRAEKKNASGGRYAPLSLVKRGAPARQGSVPVHLSGVLLGVNGHGSNPQLSAGSEHADGNLTWTERK